jgi:DNA-binding PadR family transcriptional regulator
MTKSMAKPMTFDAIYEFFQTPQLTYLTQEMAVCYVLAVLCHQDSYGTALIENLTLEYPRYRLSDTILYEVIRFLEDNNIIESYWQRMEGRGRPRHMYHILSDAQHQAESLADLWRNYIQHSGTNKVVLHLPN